jgi:Xaa-Pro aminopeptidase
VTSSSFPYSAAELDQFRQVQRLAYDMAGAVEAQLTEGMTEAEVCRLLVDAQSVHQVTQVFHRPYAWFGRRTMLGEGPGPEAVGVLDLATAGVLPHRSFFPTGAALADGVPLILDLAPVVQGIAADVGYSCVFGHNDTFDELDRGLARVRTFLTEGVRAGETMGALTRQLQGLARQHGWESCHAHYPDRALGHLVFPVGPEPPGRSLLPGFGGAAADGLLAAGRAALKDGRAYPVWNDSPRADYRPAPGLWALEPHIGRDGVGVKFEELLVVTEHDAYWLDDHLLHTQRWAAAGYSIASLAAA